MASVDKRVSRFLETPDSSIDPSLVTEEIQTLLRRSVGPFRSPTSAELRESLPKLARLLTAYSDEVGLSDEEACSIFEMFVARIFETRIRERLSDALASTSLGRERTRTTRMSIGVGDLFVTNHHG